MSTTRWRRLFAGTLTAVLACGLPAAADPVTIVSGSVLYSRGNLAEFDLVLSGGAHLSGLFGVPESWFPDHACNACPVGSTITPSETENIRNGSTAPSVFGTVTQDGRMYFLDTLQFQITAGPLQVPSSATGLPTDSTWFTFTGLTSGTTADGSASTSLDLLGSGTVQMLFFTDEQSRTNWFSTKYTFSDTAPIPEPGTLLLLTTGAAAVAVRRRRSRIN